MLIDDYAPKPDFVETHARRIEAPAARVFEALRRTDFGRSPVIKGLLLIRSLPKLFVSSAPAAKLPRRFDLDAVIAAGFGKLAENSGEEIVLGVTGRFWRPTGNIEPFAERDFEGPIPPGLARAVWNFSILEADSKSVWLETQTRITCPDSSVRRKFGAYWLFVRPFSGWIRRVMLREIDAAVRLSRGSADA